MSDFASFRSVRVGEYFSSWEQFLGKYAQDTPRTLGGAIRRINREHRNLGDDDAEGALPGLRLAQTIVRERSTPWPTFVLGSGCLVTHDRQDGSDGVAQQLSGALVDVARLTVGTGLNNGASQQVLCSRVLEFVDELARDRSGQPLALAGLAPSEGSMRDDDDWRFIAQVSTAAMLLTRLYGEALAGTNQVVSDAHREELVISGRSGPWLEIYRDIIDPLERTLQIIALPAGAPASGARASLKSLASSVLAAVRDGRRIYRAHVELLTAFNWFFLTDGTNVYPDWSDLLLFEAFVDAEVAEYAAKPPAWHDARLKPRSTPIGVVGPVATWLTARLRQISEVSWRSRTRGAARSLRAELYDAVGALLGQQADNYHTFDELPHGTFHKPPLPTCFITTFDLELELAMWQRSIEADPPRPFVVILPVVVPALKPPDAIDLRWVWREIVPSADVDALESLRDGGAWQLIGDQLPPPLENDPKVWGRTPIIVRLAGSPLMEVSLDGATGLRQALLLDEYTAVSQTVMDLASAARGGGDDAVGLPSVLTSTNLKPRTAYMPRYWMFLGAQLSDAGVRLRLISNQITASQENITSGVRSKVAGVAVNQRSRPNDRDVFHWHGFDVVRDDVVHSKTHRLARDLQRLYDVLVDDFARVRAEIDNEGNVA